MADSKIDQALTDYATVAARLKEIHNKATVSPQDVMAVLFYANNPFPVVATPSWSRSKAKPAKAAK